MKMEEYLASKQVVFSDKKEWYEDASILQMLTLQAQRFLEFVQLPVNSEREDTITDSCEDAEAQGPAIILYTNGIVEEFEPPSKPRDVTRIGVTHNSIHLS